MTAPRTPSPATARFASAVLLASLLAPIWGCSPPPSGGMRPSSDSNSGGGSGSGSGDGKSAGGQNSAGGQIKDIAQGGNSGGSSAGSSQASAGGSSSESSSGGGDSTSNAADTTLTLSPDELRRGGVTLVQIEPREVPRTLSVPSQITMNELQTAHIAPYSDGRVTDVIAAPGDHVRRNQVLALIHSHIVHETVGALAMDYANERRAEAALTYAQSKRDRYAHLYQIQAASLEQQQTSNQELAQAQNDLSNIKASIIQETEHLADTLQIPTEQVNPNTIYTFEDVPLKSPIAGTVVTRSIAPGMVLQLGQETYAVSNLGSVWNMASVSQTDLPFLRVGQRVTVRTDAWPGETFTGRITLIGSALDPATRTIQVRATLDNRDGKLKPQMFTTATIDETAARQALFIPEAALQDINSLPVVFVTADGTHFTARSVKTAAPVNGEIEVTDGLRPGDHVAAGGSFTLKSALLKSSIGDD